MNVTCIQTNKQKATTIKQINYMQKNLKTRHSIIQERESKLMVAWATWFY